MTSSEFRRIALSFSGAEEREHMGHPDFRVAGKIFATLGYPDDDHGCIMLAPEDQEGLVGDHPKTFSPAAGAWGRAGSTCVLLRSAPRSIVAASLKAAWQHRGAKRVAAGSRTTKPKPRTRSVREVIHGR